MELEMIYLRMRHRVFVKLGRTVYLGEVAQIIAPTDIQQHLSEMVMHQVDAGDNNFIVIDAMHAIRTIHQFNPKLEVQMIGPSQTIVQVDQRKKNLAPIYFCGVWVLLFIGAALAIMNFHADVSMDAVHEKIYEIVTGKANKRPYILQIPYSLGLGVGMILFFNHLFRKRFNEEPSPLEIEMFNYQQDMNHYISYHENKENESKPDDD